MNGVYKRDHPLWIIIAILVSILTSIIIYGIFYLFRQNHTHDDINCCCEYCCDEWDRNVIE